MLDKLFAYRVKAVIITYKDRLSRVGYELFHYLFKRFGAEIIVISQVASPKLDTEEVFEEIIAMLHCYSMKMYSRRRNKKKLELSLDDFANNRRISKKKE